MTTSESYVWMGQCAQVAASSLTLFYLREGGTALKPDTEKIPFQPSKDPMGFRENGSKLD